MNEHRPRLVRPDALDLLRLIPDGDTFISVPELARRAGITPDEEGRIPGLRALRAAGAVTVRGVPHGEGTVFSRTPQGTGLLNRRRKRPHATHRTGAT